MSKIAQTISAILIILFTFCTNMQAGNRRSETVYAFAYGTCFNNSVIYLSTVEKLDSANIDPKTKFLTDRKFYANNFKYFLDNQYKGIHTCAIFFNKNKEKLEKTYIKLRRNTNKDKHSTLVEIPLSTFSLSKIQ